MEQLNDRDLLKTKSLREILKIVTREENYSLNRSIGPASMNKRKLDVVPTVELSAQSKKEKFKKKIN